MTNVAVHEPGACLLAFLPHPRSPHTNLKADERIEVRDKVHWFWTVGRKLRDDDTLAPIKVPCEFFTLDSFDDALIASTARPTLIASARMGDEGEGQRLLLFSAHDMLVVSRVIDAKEQNCQDLSQLQLEAEREYKRLISLPHILGVTRVFFGELDPGESIRDAKKQWLQQVRGLIGWTSTASDAWEHSRANYDLSRVAPFESEGTYTSDAYALVYSASAGSAVVEELVRAPSGHELPILVTYLMTAAKIRSLETNSNVQLNRIRDTLARIRDYLGDVHRPQLNSPGERAGRFNWLTLLAYRGRRYFGSTRRRTRRHVPHSDWHRTSKYIRRISKLQARSAKEQSQLADIATGIQINAENLNRLQKERFEAGGAEGFVSDDTAISSRALAQAHANDAYVRSAASSLQISVDLLRASTTAERAHEQEEFESRIHLLEVFIVAVYVVDLHHLSEKEGLERALLAVGAAVLVGAYILLKNRQRRLLSTVLFSVVLILLPFLTRAIWPHESSDAKGEGSGDTNVVEDEGR